MEFAILQSFDNYMEAHSIMGSLEAEGIRCWLKDETTAHELAIVGGVDPDQVLVDTNHKTAQVSMARLPAGSLATYRELERRIAAVEPEWKIVLIPPALPLPSIENADDRPAALEIAAWAARRLNLAVLINGRGDDADEVEQKLRSVGVAVQRSNTGRLSLDWDISDLGEG